MSGLWVFPSLLQKVNVLQPQLYPTLSDPMDCSLSGSSVHGIFQARVLEWVAIAFSGVNTTVYKIANKDLGFPGGSW